MGKSMIGYKATDKDMKCRGFQFELGKWYYHEGPLEECKSGFHFCEQPSGPWAYYDDPGTRIFKVECEGVLEKAFEPGADAKQVCSRIRLIEELTPTGDSNTGDRNTGHSNTGDSNTGHWNTGDRNTGFMNTDEPKMRIFNVQTELTFNECSCFRWFSVLMAVNPVTVRYWNEMNEKEQADNPKAKVTGYLVESTTMKEAYAKWWNGLKAADKKEMESIPNFNKTLFKELTGIEYDP